MRPGDLNPPPPPQHPIHPARKKELPASSRKIRNSVELLFSGLSVHTRYLSLLETSSLSAVKEQHLIPCPNKCGLFLHLRRLEMKKEPWGLVGAVLCEGEGWQDRGHQGEDARDQG